MNSPLLPILEIGLPTGIVKPFAKQVATDVGPLVRTSLTDLQINLGKLCNQTCTHCHVDAGPTKIRENMDLSTADRVVELALACDSLTTIDLTGGAPELNPHFRTMVKRFRDANLRVIDRCNLTVLSEPSQTEPQQPDLAEFLARHEVDVVASLPCYLQDNVDGQRGNGVFQRSINGIRKLNSLGYGNRLRLDLVFNPTSPSLPPDQQQLEADYKRELKARYDIEFNSLLCITNIPIKRYAKFLEKQGLLEDYMRLLYENYRSSAAKHVMCKSMLSISWDGTLHDCDFNQMLEIPVGEREPTKIFDIESLSHFVDERIAVADHCYGCTAGAGSSCSGAILS